ncbi:MAG: small multi-drug export protein [bacterium]|nr:small multi-drug export protein [bacterium]
MIPEIKVFLVAMSPIVELRGAIPLALKVYGLSLWEAYILSVAGNLVPLLGIVIFGRPIAKFLSRMHPSFQKFFDWLFNAVGKKASVLLGKIGSDLTVLVLTALPIPFVGGWTGAIAAMLLDVPKKRGAILVVLGAMISGLIVAFVSSI